MKPKYSMKRGYRILYLHCDTCKMERPFYRVNSWPSAQKRVVRKVKGKWLAQDSDNPIPNISPDARLVNATCMFCAKASQFVLSVKVLGRSRHAMADLCSCGLPAMHIGPHLGELSGHSY